MRARFTIIAALTALAACGDAVFAPEDAPNQATVARIDVRLASGEMNPGDTATATASAFNSDGDEVPLVDFVWSSSDSTVVSVQAGAQTQQALVTAGVLGTASLVARVGGVSSQPVVVTVVEPDPEGAAAR